MPIWKTTPDLDSIREHQRNTLGGLIGLDVFEVGDDYLRGRLPVDSRTQQPMGRLHGGASGALIEELASIGANHCNESPDVAMVGIELNANHVRGILSGMVIGTARPLHIGRSTQVWEVRIEDERQRLISIGRLTTAAARRG